MFDPGEAECAEHQRVEGGGALEVRGGEVDMVEPEGAQRLLDRGTVEVAPLAFMRGRTLNSSFIILDEAQNTTPEQMKMFLTRLGFGSKMVVTGDVTQIDLESHQTSGMIEAMTTLRDIDGIGVVKLMKHDIVRHRLVQNIVQAYKDKQDKEISTRRSRENDGRSDGL